MSRLNSAIKKYGILIVIIMFFKKIFYKLFSFFSNKENKLINKREEKRIKKIELKKKREEEKRLQEEKRQKELKLKEERAFLDKLAHDRKYKYVFVFYPYVQWNMPIFQRPQQIALSLTKKRDDILYFYCSSDIYQDELTGIYRKLNDNLYVVSDYDYLCSLNIKNRVMHFYSTDTFSKYTEIQNALDRNDKVLYEYIDEINESITGKYPEGYLEKHEKALKNEDIYLVTTADKLYEDAKKCRKSRFTLSTNGVHVEDFDKTNTIIPDDLADIKKKYSKVICYYGALAVWFDYDLIIKCAKKYPKYAFVLIGIEYDTTLRESKILDEKNIFYLGKKPYSELVNYTKNVDLLTIPFLINEITISTSPVKLFEYMATKKPILTTAMPECKKYKSVIIGNDHEDFFAKIDSTIKLNDDCNYLNEEYNEALENTWDMKANAIIDLLEEE